jgi:cobalt/nickel transport system ATP-binding protein
VALIGPNGAGKSTLLLTLNGTLAFDGEIKVCGLAVNRENLPVVRAAVGLLFEDPDDQLFSPTVWEEVAFGPLHMGWPRADISSKVGEALAAVGMSGHEKRVPHDLSQGEKKRVAIASVLVMDPEILALDDPTGGLDPRARRELGELLTEMPQTMLIATHDMRLVRDLTTRSVVLNGGRVVAEGLTAELLRDRELLETNGLEQPEGWAD